MPKKTKRRTPQSHTDTDEELAAIEALALQDSDAPDAEHEQIDAMRQCIIAANAAKYIELLEEQGLHGASPSFPMVYLMEWIHQWQQEYEAFVHVLEQEEEAAEACAIAEEGATAPTAGERISDKDVIEMEQEAQQVMQGFASIVGDLLTTLQIENPTTLVDKYGWTLLMQAANAGLRELMEKLLTYPGVDVNSTGKSEGSVTPLYLAIQSEHTKEAMVLLKNGAIASATQIVRTRKPTLGANEENDDATTPSEHDTEEDGEEEEDCALLLACRLSNLIVIEEMIALGVDINFALPSTGDRPLHVAVMFEMRDVVELLLANEQLEVNAKNLCGQTCLFGCSSVDIAELLISKGVDPKERDEDDETAFSVADALGDEEVAAFLQPISC